MLLTLRVTLAKTVLNCCENRPQNINFRKILIFLRVLANFKVS